MKLKILLAGIMGALMLFSLLASADYSGDHPLIRYDRGMTYGGLVYETVEDGSGYTTMNAMDPNTMSQNLTIEIPDGATIVTARLYNYFSWSTPDYRDYTNPGDPAEATLTFNGAEVTCQNPNRISNPIDYDNGVVQYWDSKGQGYTSTSYDCPSGTFAWDVTDLVSGSGTYTATITNADSTPTNSSSGASEYFTTYGFAILVVYDLEPDNPDASEHYYWIMEGADMLKGDNSFETPEDATTSALFGGIPKPKFLQMQNAELTTVVVSSEKPDLNEIFFNSVSIGNSTATNDKAIGVEEFDVTGSLSHRQNLVEIQDRGDYMVASNAFLVVEY